MMKRRVRDSNPQAREGAGFQDRCISHSANPPISSRTNRWKLGILCPIVKQELGIGLFQNHHVNLQTWQSSFKGESRETAAATFS